MKVRFKDPYGNLPQSMLRLGYASQVELHLKEGVDYPVYGISIWKSVVHYLIIGFDLSLPDWIPADLFIVVDSTLPPTWHFLYLGESHPSEISMRMGYKELVDDETHGTELIERKPSAIKIFLARKYEMEQAEF